MLYFHLRQLKFKRFVLSVKQTHGESFGSELAELPYLLFYFTAFLMIICLLLANVYNCFVSGEHFGLAYLRSQDSEISHCSNKLTLQGLLRTMVNKPLRHGNLAVSTR